MNSMIENKKEATTTFMMVPVTECAWCHKIKLAGMDERKKESWTERSPISTTEHPQVSHSVCPTCRQKVMEDMYHSCA